MALESIASQALASERFPRHGCRYYLTYAHVNIKHQLNTKIQDNAPNAWYRFKVELNNLFPSHPTISHGHDSVRKEGTVNADEALGSARCSSHALPQTPSVRCRPR
uniref:Uncharacterized protein n=1 Tax=Oryza brachyantha TaxID=4533 RepID=J3LL03_ORYBR